MNSNDSVEYNADTGEVDVTTRYSGFKMPDEKGINSAFYPSLAKQTPLSSEPLAYMPYIVPKQDNVKDDPTFGESLKASFRQFNMPFRALKALYESGGNFGPILGREEGYNPIEEGLLNDIPEQYWYRVLRQGTRNDAVLTIQNIQEELQDRDTMERSGGFTNFVSTMGAVMLDPTVLIPISQSIKYAQISKAFVASAIVTARDLAPIIVAQNAVLAGTKETEGVKEWAINSLVETLGAAAFGGILGAYASRGFGKQQALAEAYIKAADSGVEILAKLPEDGKGMPRLIAQPAKGASGGAAAVDPIQTLLDKGQVSWADNPYMRKIFGWSSPLVKGLTSPFKATREATMMLFPNIYETTRGVGRERFIRDPSAWEFVQSWNHKSAVAEKLFDDMYFEYVGIEGKFKSLQESALKAQAALSGNESKFITKAEFAEMSGPAFRRGGSDIPQLDRIVKHYKNEIYDPLFKELQSIMPGLTEEEFTNITQYLNRRYAKERIKLNPSFEEGGFKYDITQYLNSLNEQRANFIKPIETVKEQLKSTKEAIKELRATKQEGYQSKIEDLENAARNLEAEFERLEFELTEQILDKKIPRDLLDGKMNISREGLEAAERITKPLKDAEKELEAARKAKDKEKISELKEKIEKIHEEIQQKLQTEDIPTDAFYYKKGAKRATFITREDLPKLIGHRSEEAIYNAANDIYHTVTQLNDEQIAGSIFDAIQGGGNDVTKSRTLLWNDEIAEKWLENDLTKLANTYTSQVSKRVYYDKTISKLTGNPSRGQSAKFKLAEELGRERDIREAQILNTLQGEARTKALKKLSKEFDAEIKFQEKLNKLYFGDLVNRESMMYRPAQALKQFSVATMLGNVPILQLTEYASPLFRFTFDEYLGDGMQAAFAHIQHRMAKAAPEMKEAWRGAFADCGLAMNAVEGGRVKAIYGLSEDAADRTMLETGISNIAKMSQQLSLANMNMDLQELIVSFASQSRLIRIMEKYKADPKSLLAHEIDVLDRARLNPNEWADRITSQFGINKTKEGAYVANFHLWEDSEAATRFGIAIESEVRQVIIKPSPLDTPFWMRDPTLSMAMQFTSFMFTATHNFLIPTLTKMDAQKMMGIVAMMGVSSMIGPLRQLARGEEPDLSPESLFREGLLNSGVMGIQLDALMRANAMIDAPILRPLQPDRFKRKATGAFQLGPVSSLADMSTSIVSAVANGEWNRSDARKAIRLLVPFSGTWYLRRLVDKVLEGSDLPETRARAKAMKESD